MIGYRGKMFMAHRLVYEQAHGPLTAEKPYVLHACDNPPCCNLRHLFAGTNADNIRDMFAKHRRSQSGASNAHAKLTESDVSNIRTRLAGGHAPAEIARDYGVTAESIRAIRRGTRWAK